MFQMCATHNKQFDKFYARAASVLKKRDNADCPVSFRSNPPQSSRSSLSDNHTPILVYKRRKTVLVYKRRKSRSTTLAIASKGFLESATRSRESCPSVIFDAPPLAGKHRYPEIAYSQKFEAGEASATPISVCASEPHDSRLESHNCSSVLEDLDPDGFVEKVGQKTIEVESLNDCCSSSRSNVELVSASTRSEMDGTCECSSSSVILENATVKEITEKDFCISLLRKHGVFGHAQPRKNHCSSSEDIGISGGKSHTRSCKACYRTSFTQKMLICDQCEGAFHLSCCYLRVKDLPVDEWFCLSCRITKPKSLHESGCRTSASIISAKWRNINSLSTTAGPIALMLRDKEPHRTDVRVGKDFQIDVTDWFGPVEDDFDAFGEPLEMDLSAFSGVHTNEPGKQGLVSNWLQCKEILDVLEGNGVTCGKWRRAPLFEVQTDDWECFQAFRWDPAHADCAAPQELETEEILQQVKHIRQMRPRLAAENKQHVHEKNSDLFCCKDASAPRDSTGNKDDRNRIRNDIRHVYVRRRTRTK